MTVIEGLKGWFKRNAGLCNLLPIFLLILIAASLYYNTFDNEFTYWDDMRYVTTNERIKDITWSKLLDIFNPLDIIEHNDLFNTEYLPLMTLTHIIDYHFWGLNPTGYHLSNLILYISGIFLLYIFFNLILKNKMVSFLASLIFAVHPVHVESVTWIAARKDVLSFVFFILSFYLYVRFVRKEGNAWFYYIGSLLAFTMALLSKSLVVILPFLLVLYDFCFEEGKFKIINKVPYLVIGILLTVIYMANNTNIGDSAYLTARIGGYRLGLTNLMVLTEYVGMLFLPLNLNAYYSYGFDDIPVSILELKEIFYLFVFLLMLLIAITSYVKGKRLVTFCIIWFFIALIPVINIIPTSTLRADRYLFIPSVGFSLLVAYVTYNLFSLSPNRILKGVVSVVFIIILTFFSALTIERNNIWQNGITLWQDAIAKNPNNVQAHFGLGNEYRHRKNWDTAIIKYEKVLKLKQNHIRACVNLGASYGVIGRYEKAISVLKRCLEIDSSFPNVRLNLAKAYLSLGSKYLARQELAEILRRDPNNTKALRMLEGF